MKPKSAAPSRVADELGVPPRLSPLWIVFISLLALLLVAATFAIELVNSRQNTLNSGMRQVNYHTHMMVEHVARSFDGIEILLEELKPRISSVEPWWNWTPHQGHEFLKGRLLRSLPPVRHLLIFDADGNQRYTSFSELPAPVNIVDRPYFRLLRDGLPKMHYGPYVGRNTGQLTYAIVQRLEFPDRRFAGVLMLAVEPAYFEKFCAETRPHPGLESALVTGEGRVVSLCRDLPDPDTPLVSSAAVAAGVAGGSGMAGVQGGKGMAFIDGKFDTVLGSGALLGIPLDLRTPGMEYGDFIVAAEAVPSYAGLRVVSVLPRTAILEPWRRYAMQLALLGGVALLALGLAAAMLVRQYRQINRSAEQLEARVREATHELEHRRRDAERVAEGKSRFLAYASHDLRQPVHALQLFVADLERQLGNEHRSLIRPLRQATDAMRSQVENLLELSRLDLAEIQPVWQHVALSDVFAELESTYSLLARSARVRLLFHIRVGFVLSDPGLLHRMLGNLIDNAIKFTPGGTVLVCSRWCEGGARIEIRDNGVGIAKEFQQGVYAEFQQLDVAQDEAEQVRSGVGLGLSIVSRLAHFLHAPVSLRSAPGRGTVFAVRLDQRQLPASARAIQPSGEPMQLESPPAILLVGDDHPPLRLVATLCANWGYPVAIVADLAAARRQIAAEDCIPILFMDHCQNDQVSQLNFLNDSRAIAVHVGSLSSDLLGPWSLQEPVQPARLRALLRSIQAVVAQHAQDSRAASAELS